MQSLCISCQREELDQGLFGQIFYHLFQVLPYLYANRIYPQWELRSMHYGDPPGYLTIPGALDLSYAPPSGPYRYISLYEMRRRHAHVLGNDWVALNQIWSSYFSIPPRVLAQADQLVPGGRVLGIHYRGTDKQTTSWDSNPISQDEYLTIVADFLEARDDFEVIFAATDEFSFVDKLRGFSKLPVVSLGEVEFHLATEHSTSRAEKTDRALLDCVLLSRCACVLETSSALPSFAKLFNPSLEIYRSSASKLFGKLYTNMPYFPVAHIPVVPARGVKAAQILQRTIQQDWTEAEEAAAFRKPFVASPRWGFNHKVYSVAEQLQVDGLLARVLSGHY